MGGALELEALRRERLTETTGIEVLRDATADDLHGAAHGHILARLLVMRPAEEHIHQFLFYLWRLKLAVVYGQALDVGLVEPELEALLVEGIRLRVYALVVEGVLPGREDAVDLEGQSAAVACGVGEELRIVARAAERGDVFAVLVEMRVRRPLVDAGHGHGGLQLVEFRGPHGVEFLAAHQSVLRQRQQVVAPHAVGVGLRIEVA